MDKVSVIIPTFNRAHTLKRAIDSVLAQTFDNFELIIVDDGSTDDTKVLIDSYNDKRMSYYYINNSGVSAARNFGIEEANGDWIALLDSDDEWLPHKLEQQLSFAITNPTLRLIHTEEIWVRRGKRVNPKFKHKKGGGDQFIPSLKLCLISPSSVMIRKDVFTEIGKFNENFPVCEDYDLWLRITAQEKVGFIEQACIIKHGGHDDQLSAKFVAMDWYRVLSMANLLNIQTLTPPKKTALLNELNLKTEILKVGFRKHGNDQFHLKLMHAQEHEFAPQVLSDLLTGGPELLR